MKERIIGAVVLVVFVVLVVPVFLDGPPDDGDTVSERILLPGQDGQDTRTVVLDRERTEPMPAVSSQEAASPPDDDIAQQPIEEEPAPDPVVETPRPRADPPPAQKPEMQVAEPAASSTGMWAVQLGSFGNEENAENQAATLRKQGYAAFVSQYKSGSSQFYRVRIGPQKDREAAEAMAARLLKVGHEGQVLPHP